MNNVLLYVGALIAIALAALFGAPHLVDWNTYRGTFEEEASRLLGREVRVSGDVNLTLLPTPAVRFGKVRIADTTGRFGEPFFRTDDFALHLNVAPLLKGIVEANQIELSRPVLRLAFDDQGRGNWLGLGPRPGASGLIPQEVALQSVRITDGMIVIHGAKGEERLSLRNINGELSAEALEGPYKFKGAYRLGDSAHEIRVATARADTDGTMRLKVGVDILASATSLELSGQLSDIGTRPRLEGDLTTRIKPPSAAPADAKAGTDAQTYEVKAKAQADADGFAVSDINFAFDADGRPQLVTGGLKGTWSAPVAMKATVASRWLDADRLIGVQPDVGPGSVLASTASRILDLLPAGADASLDAVFDQITLAGDMVGGVRVGIDRHADRLAIREFRASLPGATRLDLRGTVAGFGGPEARYDGEMTLRGQSLARLLAWSFRGNRTAPIAKDGPFGWISGIAATTSEVTASDVRAEVGGQALRGSLGLTFGKRPRLAVDVEALTLDLAAFPAIPEGWIDIVRRAVPEMSAERTKSPDLDLRLRAVVGRMAWGERMLRDVDAQASIEGDRLAILGLRMHFDDGLAIDLSGELDGISSGARGTIAGVVSVPSAAALEAATGLMRIPDSWRPSDKRAAAMTPMRLAYRAVLPTSRKDAVAITFDGSARDTRVTIDGKVVASETGSWIDAKADVTLELSGNEARGLLTLIAPQAVEFADRVGAKPARLTARGLGQLGSGAFALVTLDTDGMAGSYSGNILSLQSGAAPRLDGELTFKGELQRALVLAGLGARPGIDSQPIDGSVRITSTDDSINLNARELHIDGILVSGTANIASSAGKKQIDAKLTADSASVTRLLTLVLDARAAAAPASLAAAAAAAAVAAVPGRWPEDAFDLSGLEGFIARVSLTTPKLWLADTVALHDAKLEASIGDGAIDVTRIVGTAMEGEVAGKMKLQKVPGGATLTGELTVTNAALATLSATGPEPAATGSASAKIQVSSRATSPRGLVASLQGKGSIDIGTMRLKRFAPKTIRAAAETYLQASPNATEPDAIRARITESLSGGEISVGHKRLIMIVQDGRIAFNELDMTTPEGRVAARIALDLNTFNLDSEWRIEAQSPPLAGRTEGRGFMPPVTVTYSGPLSDFGMLQPQVKTDAFERELMVRRMERDVDELERLRRLDEERAKAETERQRRVEASREAASTTAPAAPSPVMPLPPASGTTAPPGSAATSPGPSGAPPAGPAPVNPLPEASPEAIRRPDGIPRSPSVRSPAATPKPGYAFPTDLGG